MKNFNNSWIEKGNLLYDIVNIEKEGSPSGVTPRKGEPSSISNIQQNNEYFNNGPEILDAMPTTKNSTIQGLKKDIDTFRKKND